MSQQPLRAPTFGESIWFFRQGQERLGIRNATFQVTGRCRPNRKNLHSLNQP